MKIGHVAWQVNGYDLPLAVERFAKARGKASNNQACVINFLTETNEVVSNVNFFRLPRQSQDRSPFFVCKHGSPSQAIDEQVQRRLSNFGQGWFDPVGR